MFWQSVVSGFLAFFDWHILVGALGIGIASVLHPFIAGLAMGDGESGGRMGTGCLIMLLGGPLVQAISVSAFILFCLPAIIGNGGFLPMDYVASLAGPVMKTGLIAFGLVMIMCFIPIIGRLITNTPGVTVFLQGILMLQPITKNLLYAISGGKELPPDVFPSFWHSVGYVIIGIGICWVVLVLVLTVLDERKKRTNPIGHMMDQYRSPPSGGMTIVGMFIGPIFGILPLLMYGQYIYISLS